MQIQLGLRPDELTVSLSRDTSFVAALVAPEDWPVGTDIELRFTDGADDTTPTVWPASIDGERADWYQPDTACAAVLDAGKTRVRLVCIDPQGRDLLWARGWVRAD